MKCDQCGYDTEKTIFYENFGDICFNCFKDDMEWEIKNKIETLITYFEVMEAIELREEDIEKLQKDVKDSFQWGIKNRFNIESIDEEQYDIEKMDEEKYENM